MINYDIQELFDGLLNDEQTAELLHTLSVSPERRTDFRRHMQMQGEMGRDRNASGLTSDEDRAIWGAIGAGIGIGTPATTAAVGTGMLAWVGRGAAVLVIGLAGYLLGSNSSVDGSISRSTVVAPAAAAARPTGSVKKSDGLVSSQYGEHLASARTVPVPSVVDRIVYRDRIVNRIVYRDRFMKDPSLSQISAVDRSSGRTTSPVDNRAKPDLDQPLQQNAPTQNAPTQNTPTENKLFHKRTDTPPQQFRMIADSSDGNANANATDRNSQPIDPTVPIAQRNGKSETPSQDAGSGMMASLQTSGLEVAYSERVGRLATAPQGEQQSSNYGARYIDFSYRFDQGHYGLGMRVGTGSFSTVTLQPTQSIRREGSLSRIDTIYRPKIGESRENAVEFFFNYRLPISDRIGLGAEMAYNISTTHQKVGGDIFALFFLTERVGMQVGGGLSRYWYNLGSERQRLMNEGSNVGVSDDVLDSYAGSVLEGRYGLFYRF